MTAKRVASGDAPVELATAVVDMLVARAIGHDPVKVGKKKYCMPCNREVDGACDIYRDAVEELLAGGVDPARWKL